MSPKPGTKVTLVPPTAPAAAKEAVEAATGATTELQRTPAQTEAAKIASVKVPPHKPPETQEEKERKSSWIEIEMVDAADRPVAGMRYRVTLPDGTADEGTLDAKGFARIEGFEPGQCKVTFPEADEEAWEAL